MNTEFNNKPYDEEVWLEEATSEDLEDAANIEREYEDAYDAAFTNLMVEKFPHLTNTNYISSPDSDTKKSDVFVFRPQTPPKNNSETSLDSLDRSSDTNYSTNTINIGNGKFEYVSNKFKREMLVNAWQSITQTNMWDFVKQDIESFMWSKDPRIDIISEKMEELGYSGHSGCSFGCTMRNMQHLAKNGENKFKQMFNGNDIEVEEIEEAEQVDSDVEANPYENEDAMEHEQRLKKLIKRRIETRYYEKRDKEEKEAREKKLLEYMGGF